MNQTLAALTESNAQRMGELRATLEAKIKADFGDVAQPDQTSVGKKIDVEEIVLGPEGAGQADRKLLVAGLQGARRDDRILRLKRRD